MHVITLATCHNRRDMTLQALKDLHAQELPRSITIEHVIVNDGCTDNTAEAVSEYYPDVEVLTGTGQLYWAGGMRFGWHQSVSRKKFDYLFVYNDDIRLHKNSLSSLIETSVQFKKDGGSFSHAVSGAFCSSDGNVTTYGGVVAKSRLNPLRFVKVDPRNDNYQIVDTVNMNACLISSDALELVGFLSPFYEHSGADYDFGLKLRTAGGTVNKNQDNFIDKETSLIDAYKVVLSKKREPFMQRYHYYKSHGGVFWIFNFVKFYLSFPFYFIIKKYLRF